MVTAVPGASGVLAASGRDAAALVTGAQRGSPVSAAGFGVTSVLIDASAAAALGIPQGALIRTVSATGPAAGVLVPGDIVVAVNGSSVTSANGLQPGDFGLVNGDRATLQVTGATGGARTVTITVAGD